MYSEDSQWMVPHGLRMLVLCIMASILFLKKKILGDVIGNKLHIIVLICIPLISTKPKLYIRVYGLCESLLELFVPLTHFFSLFRSWCSSYLEEGFINYGYYLFQFFLLAFSLVFHGLLPYLLELFYLIFIFFHCLLPHVYFILVLLQLVLLKIQLDAQASLLILELQTVGRKEN